MFKSDVLLKNKECILIGKIEECERFYCCFHNKYNIKHIVLEKGKENEVRLDGYDNLFVTYFDIEANLNDYYLILCEETNIGNNQWDDILYKKGFYYKDDYIDSFYIYMINSEEKRKNLQNKEIWIFGAGDNGYQFWNEFHEEYNICGFVSNYENENEKCGLPVVRLNKIANGDDKFIVICSNYEIDMYDQLLQLGKSEEKDFTFSEFFSKKLFIGIGACEISDITDMLKQNRSFKSRFVSMIFGETPMNYTRMANRMRLKVFADFCDVFLYQTRNLKTSDELDYSLMLKENNKALKIQVPFYYFQGIYMQMNVPKTEKKEFSIMCSEGAFSNHAIYCYNMDKEILLMVENGLEDEEICSKILSDNYFSKEEVLRNFDLSVKALEILDMFSDIKIKPFLLDNYKRIPVFTDAIHFGPELSIYLANKVAQQIGIRDIDNDDAVKLIEQFKKYHNFNLYIYPSVAKALELEYWNNELEYQNTPYEHGKGIKMREYVMKQIKFVKKVNDLWNWLGAAKEDSLRNGDIRKE